jgi:hypothetical protein
MLIIIFVTEYKLKIFWLILRLKKKHENIYHNKIVTALHEIMATMRHESATCIGCSSTNSAGRWICKQLPLCRQMQFSLKCLFRKAS